MKGRGHRGQPYCLLTAALKGTADYRLCLVDEAHEFSNLLKVTQGHGKVETPRPQGGSPGPQSTEVSGNQGGTPGDGLSPQGSAVEELTATCCSQQW